MSYTWIPWKLVLPSRFISWKSPLLTLAGSGSYQIWLGREPIALRWYWSIHTKDESKCETAFAFIFGVNWLWFCMEWNVTEWQVSWNSWIALILCWIKTYQTHVPMYGFPIITMLSSHLLQLIKIPVCSYSRNCSKPHHDTIRWECFHFFLSKHVIWF